MKRKVPKDLAGSVTIRQSPKTDGKQPKIPASAAEAASMIMEALVFGELAAPISIQEIEELCPAVWKRAVRAFKGDLAAARDWMDSPSRLLEEERPLLVAMRFGGARKVLQALAKASANDDRDESATSAYATKNEKANGQRAPRDGQ